MGAAKADETEQRPRPTRRSFLQSAVGAGVSAALASIPADSEEAPKPPYTTQPAGQLPNILYIHSHDTGRYVRPYGHDIPTPTLQRIAAKGILFRNAFSGAPTCSPSRACLLTGICAHQNGMMGLAHLGWSLHDYRQHIIHTLSKAGYLSILGGLQHIAAKPEVIGYDVILQHKSNSAVAVAPAVAAFLATRPKQPFFLDVGFFETHRAYPDPTSDDNAAYIVPPGATPDTAETRQDMAAFHASARIMDKGVSDVLAALEKNGYLENTLILSTTDHGISFPEMKCSLRDAGWGVSMILCGPAPFNGGKICDAMVSQLDVFPSLCEHLGIEKPSWLQGKSFMPVLRGEQKEINEEIFAEVTYHAAYEPKRAVRTHRYKYARRYDARTTAVLPNCDDGLSKSLWLKDGWQKEHLVHREELYDLIFDPTERNNLVGDSDHQFALDDMRGRLDAWMKRTEDPLLNGPVPLPIGGRATDPDAISPKGLGHIEA